jgi:hypothetical protein
MIQSHSNLDVLTPRGTVSRQWEDRAVELWSSQWPDLKYVHTPKDKPAIVDALLIKNGAVVGVVETKCRPSLSLVDFKVTHNMRWLVTNEKLQKAQVIAAGLSVPLIGFLYMPEQDLLLYNSLWKPEKGWVVDIETKTTKTQATINGGTAWRENAYIDMTNSKMIIGQ